MDIPDLTCTVLVRPYRWPWRIHIAIYRISIEKTQIPVNILPRTVRTSRLDQNVALRMRINGHTRLDLYSSCTAVQVTLKNSHSYIRISIEKTQILQLTYFPSTVIQAEPFHVTRNRSCSGWESMDILSMTWPVSAVLIRVNILKVAWPWRIPPKFS